MAFGKNTTYWCRKVLKVLPFLVRTYTEPSNPDKRVNSRISSLILLTVLGRRAG